MSYAFNFQMGNRIANWQRNRNCNGNLVGLLRISGVAMKTATKEFGNLKPAVMVFLRNNKIAIGKWIHIYNENKIAKQIAILPNAFVSSRWNRKLFRILSNAYVARYVQIVIRNFQRRAPKLWNDELLLMLRSRLARDVKPRREKYITMPQRAMCSKPGASITKIISIKTQFHWRIV